MPHLYLLASMILSCSLILIGCTPYRGDAPPITGDVSVFVNQNNHLCFQPQIENAVHLGEKVSNFSLKSIRYDSEQIDRIPRERMEAAKTKIQNSTGDDKISALNDYLALEDSKPIWYAEINNSDKLFYKIEPLCIDEHNPDYTQKKYANPRKGSNYYVYIRGYTKNDRNYAFFSNSFNYDEHLPADNTIKKHLVD